jgi:hypothetical protein
MRTVTLSRDPTENFAVTVRVAVAEEEEEEEEDLFVFNDIVEGPRSSSRSP